MAKHPTVKGERAITVFAHGQAGAVQSEREPVSAERFAAPLEKNEFKTFRYDIHMISCRSGDPAPHKHPLYSHCRLSPDGTFMATQARSRRIERSGIPPLFGFQSRSVWCLNFRPMLSTSKLLSTRSGSRPHRNPCVILTGICSESGGQGALPARSALTMSRMGLRHSS